MKKIILGLLASCLLLAASITPTKAQVSLNVTLGNTWNPPAEYSGVKYYYFPDVDSYYYVPNHKFVYLINGEWVFRSNLPDRYRGYDIRRGYKVAVDRPQAYKYYNEDRARYAHYKGVSQKEVIVRDNYRVINRTKVINNTRYIKSKPRVITKTRYIKSKPRVITKTKYVNVHKDAHRGGNNGQHKGHDKH